jgi:hypothetical protein
MTSDDLTKEQIEQLLKSINPTVGFLGRLERRMEKTQWANNDPVYVATRAARDALQSLSMTLHYLTCEGTKAPASLDAMAKMPPTK